MTSFLISEKKFEAIRYCDGNKAPGPDGFNLACIKKDWDFMKGDIMRLCMNFIQIAVCQMVLIPHS